MKVTKRRRPRLGQRLPVAMGAIGPPSDISGSGRAAAALAKAARSGSVAQRRTVSLFVMVFLVSFFIGTVAFVLSVITEFL